MNEEFVEIYDADDAALIDDMDLSDEDTIEGELVWNGECFELY